MANVTDTSQSESVLHALLAATPTLSIPTEEVDGLPGPARNGGERAMIIFDTVPGGAGNVKCMRENLEPLMREARRIVATCQCTPDTSCYGCLRTYRNQRLHERLSRGKALDGLNALLGGLR